MLDSLVDKTFLSIDWDARTLRIVQARGRKRSVTVDQVLSVPISSDVRISDAGAFGRFMAKALAKAGIAVKRAVVDIPRDKVNYYTLDLPNASLNDLAGMVAFQIPKELPYPVSQAVVDFIVPEGSEGETNDVMVAAVPREVLNHYVQVFAAAGLKLQRVGLRPNASQFAINALLAATPHDEVLFVDVGPTTTEIDVLYKGRLVFSRAADVIIPKSFDQAKEPSPEETSDNHGLTLVTPVEQDQSAFEKVVRSLMIEVTRSVEAYRVADAKGSIDHAVIGGTTEIEEALTEAIQKQYNITAQPYNPANCFGWDADRGAAAGGFAATLGLVLAQTQPEQLNFNFLDPKKTVSRAKRRIKRAPFVGAAAALLIAAGVLSYFQWVKPQYESRERLSAEIAAIQDELKNHREFIKVVKAVQDYEREQIVWLDELRDLVSVLPDQKQMVLTGLDMSQKEKRIKMPFKAKGPTVGKETLDALQAFRLPHVERQQFKALPGPTRVKAKQLYPHTGSLDITIVDRDFSDG